jgi:hypothetical protein
LSWTLENQIVDGFLEYRREEKEKVGASTYGKIRGSERNC